MKKIIFTATLLFANFGNHIFAQQENTISETGNIGIGTTAPEATLDVHGSVKIDSVLNVKDSAVFEKNMRVQQDMRIDGDSRFNNVQILGNLETEGGNKFMGPIVMNGLDQTYSFENGNFLFLDSNGNAKRTPYDSVVNVLKSGISAEIYQVKQCPDGDILAPTWSNGVNKIFNACPQVNVGIGTNNPLVKLDVRGTASVGKIAINATDPVTALGTKLFYLKSHYNPNSSTHGNVPIFLIENSERALFQINNDGIVRSREIKVNLDTVWPDYVFEATYKLQPLSEVKQFIEKNGHLPNVPSAKQIEEDGVSLGEMNRILLEKVEELTLHLIEQQKMLEAQSIRLNELETKKN